MSWPMVKLGSIGEFKAGFGFPIEYQGKKEGDYPFAKVGDISAVVRSGHKNIFHAGNYIDKDILRNLKAKTIPKGTIVFAKIGEAIKQNFRAVTTVEMVIDNNVMGLVPDNNLVDTNYLFYFMRSLDLYQFSGATTIPALRKSILENIQIPLPPLSEQKRIAAILDKADSIRQKREQAIKLADDFLRATFLEMFPQLDDCGNRVKLGDIVTLDAPMVDPREDKFIDLIHIGPDRIEKNTGLLLSALTAREENLISKKFLFDESYVLYSKIRPYLKKCAIPDFSGLCSADMYPVKPIANKTNREFLWQLLLSDFFTKYTETLPDRANIPKLNRKELLNFEISLPPFSLQENYRAIVQKINNTKSIMRIQSNNDLLNRLTDKLFSKDQ
ncbi:restriction endonuclease subunit S [Klebsiella pneumoniae]|uniref:restriction endonuclease subunit S n=1 Tax=Klebsiella pneumoniae TaxID=573 RepID=UPI001E642749|nr:restriction endonuclease subunit S [Klebsiella pneumoniae]HBQ5876551.1 restriction endonuclease subunit S [Klebsiella pneumoniae subsp. pneumoniae]EJM9052167.1 restriction endonuclease subunit S [Klebsiella pneumoniae]EKV0318153.1 restriction endonuclease subunit S [Klebsiella pneumoniae]EKV3481531.1 restriction endonuclease subunit S [Klebsiella pneumoniae]EKV5106135.1 restriction endonuclease subunit S [Klebsiella pneumoniae]